MRNIRGDEHRIPTEKLSKNEDNICSRSRRGFIGNR